MTLQGQVYVSMEYDDQMQKEVTQGKSELQNMLKEFKQYWSSGLHLSFGKDSQFTRPYHPAPGILGSSLRKVHIRPEIFSTAHGIAGTQKAWDFLRVPRRATSDGYLVYAVNSNRDALVMVHLNHAHTTTLSDHFMQGLMELADNWFDLTRIKPMPVEMHDRLWDPRHW